MTVSSKVRDERFFAAEGQDIVDVFQSILTTVRLSPQTHWAALSMHNLFSYIPSSLTGPFPPRGESTRSWSTRSSDSSGSG